MASLADGPYRFVRHPGYLAMLIALPASALAIGSWPALIPAAAFILVILRRVQLEDEFLRRTCPATPIMHAMSRPSYFRITRVLRYLWTAQTVLSNEVMYASQFCNSDPTFK
jgi:hypothetical protein